MADVEDDFDDEYKTAITIGVENLELLRLAAGWCEHAGATKGPLGTGMVEELTGLPISGGSLRCDFASAPERFGMRLADTAVEFYEKNCVGCSDRRPTEAVEHLGTWADAIIAERVEREAQAELARRNAEDARTQRHAARRLLHGQPDATLQSVLDLIDRVDGGEGDSEAEQLLVKHAAMAPGDFPDALVHHLAQEAMAIGSDGLLAAVIAIFERQGRPSTETMLTIAFEAVERGIAAPHAGRVIATHAVRTALEAFAKRDPRSFVPMLRKRWTAAGAHDARVPLLGVLTSAIRDQYVFDLALPLLSGSLTSEDPGERAAALRVIGRSNRSDIQMPDDLALRVIEAFEDDKLVVFLGAIRAAWQVSVPKAAKPKLVLALLGFASAYGPERIHYDDVGSAIRLALRLAKGESYEPKVGELVLEAIAALPSAEAARLLDRLGLEDHVRWPAAAVGALRQDPDPQYDSIGDWRRDDILRELAEQPTARLAPLLDDLMEIASERLPYNHVWVWATADLLGLHNEHERAAKLCDAVVAALPDTREQQPTRTFARHIALGHHANAALAGGDYEAASQILGEWEQLSRDWGSESK